MGIFLLKEFSPSRQ